ncbi:hypothetical protein [Hydrogenimonas sp.]
MIDEKLIEGIEKKVMWALVSIGKIKQDDDGNMVYSEYAKGYMDGFRNGVKTACDIERDSVDEVDEQDWMG